MKALITGAGGLVGSQAVHSLIAEGYEVWGIENDMRKEFFGAEGSTYETLCNLHYDYEGKFNIFYKDIRNRADIEDIYAHVRPDLVIHTAAQPSHDWAAKNPHIDFGVNAIGTHNLIEAHRQFTPDSTFCHISTSKVYGDRPNYLPLKKVGSRLDLPSWHPYSEGIDTTMSVDKCLHSLFGVSKLSGDLLVQEYGRYFKIPTLILRPGCVTGPSHQGVELHGFLNYLMKCTVTGKKYTIYGYDGLQVRCNIHAQDLVDACLVYHNEPKTAGIPFNIGGGRSSACSMKEGIDYCEHISGNKLNWVYEDKPRIGDHRFWISDIKEFQSVYNWTPQHDDVYVTLQEIYEGNIDKWKSL